MNPELAVIIVNYNTGEDLRNCLDSIYSSQQNISFQVWVVDNDSGDGSMDKAQLCHPQANYISLAGNVVSPAPTIMRSAAVKVNSCFC